MTLSFALKAALDTITADGTKVREKAIHRIEDVVTQNGYKRALNNFAMGNNFFFGTTCLFWPGQSQALLKLFEENQQATLAQLLQAYEIAEKQAPAGFEYLHGLSYWLAIDDHFYQIQHVSLTSAAMEAHLTWLLKKTGIISGSQGVMLQAEFDQSQLGDDDLKFVQIGGLVADTIRTPTTPVSEALTTPPTDEIQKRQKVGDKTFSFGMARSILEQLFGKLETAGLLEAVPPEAELEVSVNIGYRSRKRKLSREFMKDLAAGLRNLPDGEVTVRGKHGKAKGQDARLYYDIGIERMSETSGLLSIEHALKQMQEVHRRLLNDGRIEP